MRSVEARTRPAHCERFDLFGVIVELASASATVIDDLDASFEHFRVTGRRAPDVRMRLVERGGGFDVEGFPETSNGWVNRDAAVGALMECMSTIVLRRLAQQGVLVVHAAALVHDGGTLMLAGPSGAGKSTLALGLLGTGMTLLSDELALIGPREQTVHPYRRSVHVRPGTPELVPAFGFLLTHPQRRYGGDIRWALPPRALERAIPGALGGSAPLHDVLLLEPRSSQAAEITAIGRGSAAVELLRGTPSAASGLPAPLARLGGALTGVRCARLRPGNLDETIAVIREWIGSLGRHV
jgi:hypothetical protein